MNKPQFVIKTIEEKDDYAKLSIEPLEQGYGHTVGNSLRRTMLSSIKGSAISLIKIDKVKHMFSTLDGMKEDIVEFILNVKQIRVKSDSDEPIEISLEVSGKKEVTAKNIKCPTGVEVMNKDLVLAHLDTPKAKLKATLTVTRGYGFVPAEEQKTSTLGVIPLDASYTPILRIKYDVRNTRVGRRTDYDNLIMDIWTDGTTKPQDALIEASKTLISYFDQIIDPVIPEVKEEKVEDPKEMETMRLTVEELDLPTRIANALRKGGYETVKDLSLTTRDEISKVKNLGGKSVEIVIEKLANKEVSLKD